VFEKKIKVAVKIKNEPQELWKIYEIVRLEKIKENKIEETKAKEKNKEKSWT